LEFASGGVDFCSFKIERRLAMPGGPRRRNCPRIFIITFQH